MAAYQMLQANSAIIRIYTLLMSVFVLAVLYFGQEIIIPLSLATLLTFLLSPVVKKIEKWIGRVAAVLVLVVIMFICVSIMGYILSVEFIDLTNQLPSYKGNIETKIQSVEFLQNDFFSSLWHRIVNSPKSAIPEAIINSSTITQAAQSVIGALVHIMVNMGFVMLLLIFMLLNREGLTSRVIRLVGQGRIRATTLAMNDASDRISHYLTMQLIINCFFGLTLTIGLYSIGVPNAVLWGVLLVVLRFIPYIGTWLAAAIPVILSFVISTSWMTPLLTLSLYLCLDLISTNFLEPHFYGASTGISSTALIIAAVFWTLLWGPVGLLLAIPLTVCLVVIGSHVPQLEFLSILLGDDQALEVHEECYHRLLTEDSNEGMVLVEKYLKENSLVVLYDAVMVPLLVKVETDLRAGDLDFEKSQLLYQGIHDIVDDLTEFPAVASPPKEPQEITQINSTCRILCLPIRSLRNEIAGEMLTQLLLQQYSNVENVLIDLKNTKTFGFVAENNIDVICIVILLPSTLLQAKALCKKLRTLTSQAKIMICLLGSQKDEEALAEKILAVGANITVASLADALVQIEKLNLELQKVKREND